MTKASQLCVLELLGHDMAYERKYATFREILSIPLTGLMKHE